jgi:hypothetical protein
MPTTTTHDAWPPERLDRLARGLYPLIFGRPAPAAAPARPCGSYPVGQM